MKYDLGCWQLDYYTALLNIDVVGAMYAKMTTISGVATTNHGYIWPLPESD